MRSLKGDSVSLRLAYDNKDKTLNQSTNSQWEKTENGQNPRLLASWGAVLAGNAPGEEPGYLTGTFFGAKLCNAAHLRARAGPHSIGPFPD